MGNFFFQFSKYFLDIKDYFRLSKNEIAKRNLATLKLGSIGGLILLAGFFILTPYIIDDWAITKEYWMMVPTLLAFSMFVVLYEKHGNNNYWVVQTACILYCSMLLYHFICISVFPYPNDPESYISCFFILMSVVFILPPWIISLIIFVAAAAFAVLVLKFKSDICISHDIFATVMSAVFSHVVMYAVYKLRLDDFYVKELYRTQSQTDLLTGLLNKKSYESQCEFLANSKEENEPCALFIVDIDHFKSINDTYGHQVGDTVLEILGKVLSSTFRAGDLVGRIGGDEFSAYIRHNGNLESLSERAELILEQFSKQVEKAVGIKVTLSMGIVVLQKGTGNYSQLYASADRALYKVKSSSHSSMEMVML